MRWRIRVLFLNICAVFFCLSSGVFAAADADVKSIEIPSGDRMHMQDVWGKLGNGGSHLNLEFEANTGDHPDSRLLVYDGTSGTIKFNNTNFQDATEKSRKRVLREFVKALQGSLVSDQTQQVIMGSMSALNSEVSMLLIPLVTESALADMYTAMIWVNPILPYVRVVFGIGAILLTIYLIATSIADLFYIGLPVARESMDLKADNKGQKKPFGISDDAISAVRETEASLKSSGSYKNAYMLYFKRRIFTYIVLSLCLLYLIGGELGGLIAWLLSLVSEVV
ncbi:MAG: hypothetical protein E6230_06690 [Paenibacillus dendritiformis]|uniref:hypothetical protein n=1 Tax=uncultured Paenibacillus sp. TaxID=227322 RepID=UPI0025D20CA5|nr:hypothetical protein [uncultured Paenibacillus sp.]MDU5141849.1 hypothetical protein [Paenibacillus dendritiformis]